MIAAARVAVIAQVVADLAEETAALLALADGASPADWVRATPAEGWTVRDQLTHLAFFDDATLLALSDPVAFGAERAALVALGERFPDVIAERYRHLPGQEALSWLARSRADLLAAYRDADPAVRLPWFGPDMGVASSATARLMETWAHGRDIADALGVEPEPTGRLRHIADLGVRTFGFSYRLRGRPVPADSVAVELDAPDGTVWSWGPQQAPDRVAGPALDFCLVVTQRRNVADTRLRVAGPVAAEWMGLAQAFAGRATGSRPSVGGRAS